MQYLLSEKGASKIKVYLFLILLFVVIHVGFKLVPMYMDFERMQDEMAMKASVAQVLKDEEIMYDLVRKAKELELPLTADNFTLQRDLDSHRMKISTQWDVEVNFLWGVYVRTYHFAPAVDVDYTVERR